MTDKVPMPGGTAIPDNTPRHDSTGQKPTHASDDACLPNSADAPNKNDTPQQNGSTFPNSTALHHNADLPGDAGSPNDTYVPTHNDAPNNSSMPNDSDFTIAAARQGIPVLDSRGEPCPAPVLAAGRWAHGAAIGDQAMLLSDDPISVIDLPAWAHMTSNAIVNITETPTHTEYLLQRR